MERPYTVAIRSVAVGGMLLSAWLAATRPLSAEESALWDHLVRPAFRDVYRMADAWSGLVYAVLAERCIGLLRLSEFSFRLPSVLAAAICCLLVWRSRNLLMAIVYVAGVAAGWFSAAQGGGVALAFWVASLYWPSRAGWLFGLALASSPIVAPLGLIYWRIKDIERVLIPAIATAFILLILPLSHAGTPDRSDARPDFQREANRRNAARGGAFQPPGGASK